VKKPLIIYGDGEMETGMNNVQYSVVIPVYNSEKTLEELTFRLQSTLQGIAENYEIIFVDDCSSDKSWEKLQKIRVHEPNVKIIHLLRNFGQHNALVCGLEYASGDYVIMMDDDLQNPPEEISKLIDKAKEGYWVVYGKFTRKMHGITENFFSKIFHRFMHKILDVPDHISISNFVICKSAVAKNITQIKSAYPFITALIIKSAPVNKIANVDVDHAARKHETSNYTVTKHLRISFNLLINYSSAPLKIIGFFGFIVSLLSIGFGVYIMIRKILEPEYGLMGWNSLMVAITFLGGTILLSLAIVGEYLRRILTEVSHGQQYVIGEMEI
jgi:polyisoprenyl-phosphate glycosyltransferase